MRKPAFEQFRASAIRRSKSLPQQAREPYRAAIVALLEDSGLFLVQRARKDGHDDALIEVHASWIGTDFSPDGVIESLRAMWPGAVFGAGEQMYWVEHEDEIVTFEFAWSNGEGQFLTGRIKITV